MFMEAVEGQGGGEGDGCMSVNKGRGKIPALCPQWTKRV